MISTFGINTGILGLNTPFPHNSKEDVYYYFLGDMSLRGILNYVGNCSITLNTSLEEKYCLKKENVDRAGMLIYIQ